MKLLSPSRKQERTEYCDRCAKVCDERCRADAVREEAQLKALRRGFRVL